MFLSENSLYTNQAEYNALITDKQKVSNLFYMNLLGFLGLLKIDHKAGAMISYLAKEKKLRPTTISDDNNDMSLVVKLALDSGIITQLAATKITKLLVLIKTKKVVGADINEDLVRDILKACRIQSNRPVMRIFSVVSDFMDAKIDLKQATAKIHKISKLPEFTDVTPEFRDLVTRGGYIGDLIKLAAPSSTAPTPQAAVAATTTVNGRTKTAHMPPNDAQTGSDADYMAMLYHMFKMRTVGRGYLERFGLMKGFDSKRFIEFVQRPDFEPVMNSDFTKWEDHPFSKYVRRQSQAAYDALIKAVANKKTQGAATTTTVNTIAAQAATTKPKPATVIHTVGVPTLNADVVQELLDQDTTPALNATLKKYHLDSTYMKSQTLIVHNLLEKGGYIKSYGEASQSGILKTDVPLLRWMARYTDDRVYVSKSMHIALLINSLVELSKGDFNKWARTFNAFEGILDKHFKYNYGGYLRIGEQVENIKATSIPNIFKMLGTTTNFPSTFVSHLRQKYSYGLSTSKLQQALLGAALNKLRGETTHKFVYSIVSELKKAGVIAREGDVVNSVGSIIADEATFQKLDPESKELINAGNGHIFNFSTEKIEASQAQRLLIIDILENGRPSLQQAREVKEWTANTSPDVNLSEVKIGLIMTMHDIYDVPREWIYAHMMTRLKELRFSYYVSDFEHEFVKHILETGAYTKANEAEFISLFDDYVANHRRNYDVIKLAWDTNYKPLIDILGKRVQPRQLVQLTGYKYHPILLVNDYPHSVIEAFGSDHTEEAVKFLNAKKLLPGNSVLVGTIKSPTFNNISSWLNSVWAVTPDSPVWDQAVDYVTTRADLPSTAIPDFILKFFKAYNPRLFDIMEQRIRASAKTDLNALLVFAKSAEPDESSAALVSNLTAIRKLDSADWERPIYTNLIATVASGGPKFNLTAKKALMRTYLRNMETLKVGSVTKSTIDSINSSYCDLMEEMMTVDPKFADLMFDQLRTTTRNMFIRRVGETKYMDLIKDELYKYPIKPEMQLTPDRIKTVLKYNNLHLAFSTKKKDVKTIKDIENSVQAGVSAVGKLNIEEPKMTEDDHDKMTLEIHNLRSSKHGNFCMKVLKTFNVTFPGARERIEAFKRANPGTEVLPRVFHGTGSVAASMVLRNGFVIVPSKDSSTVGRMLGDGIYFSNVSNKAAQYVSDNGYGRVYGTRGYLFEMEAALGERWKHHRSAGIPGATDGGAQSPEWAVFDPKNQLRIYRVHYIELVTPNELGRIAQKHNINID